MIAIAQPFDNICPNRKWRLTNGGDRMLRRHRSTEGYGKAVVPPGCGTQRRFSAGSAKYLVEKSEIVRRHLTHTGVCCLMVAHGIIFDHPNRLNRQGLKL